MLSKELKDRKERILAFMKEAAYKPLLFDELVMVLAVPAQDVEWFRHIIDELESEGKIFRTNKNRYGVPERMNLVTGRLQGHERGFGFVVQEEEDRQDIFVPADGMNGAMHNDTVVVRVNKRTATDKRAEGEVIKIVHRANKTVVGTFESSRNFGFVTPDDRKISGDIFIPKDEFNGAKTGQKVVAALEKWPEKRRNAEGRVIEILGNQDEPGTDILAVLKSYNLSEEFPADVLEQAEAISDTVTPEMIRGRRDLRPLKMVTIDSEDARDLDDAVSLEMLSNGNYRLGVHIADVSHYVKDGTPLDREALKRGTSVYLVDRVIPMLPKKLSNGICSLNPQVDRLAFSVMMEIDASGKVIDHEIFESVININERMTYNNVYKILQGESPDLMERYADFIEDFRAMEKLALILRNKRMHRGAIDFDFQEAKIVLDDKGKPVEIKRYELTIANKIIEEFMLICNETVAEHFFWTNTPFVYRIHEEPDADKMESFADFVHNLGYHLKGVNKVHPKALQDLLEKVKGTREEHIISTIMLRSLQKARYSHQNSGHFGLAAKFYSHFTSPIRRYPDLIIHRIMKEYLTGRMNDSRESYYVESLPETARHCSERERAADEAERETEDLKKAEFMKQHEGGVFKGVVANVTSFGMFIELENTIEGLVRMSSMEDDYYIYDDKHYCLIGERTRKTYRIGDSVTIMVTRADVAARQIDFILVPPEDRRDEDSEDSEHSGEAGKKAGRRKKKEVDERVLLNIRGKRKRQKAGKRAH